MNNNERNAEKGTYVYNMFWSMKTVTFVKTMNEMSDRKFEDMIKDCDDFEKDVLRSKRRQYHGKDPYNLSR